MLAKQSPAERLFTLTCCLLSSPRVGLSKQDIFKAVAGYQSQAQDGAVDRMFERDKEALRNAGVILEVLENDSFDETDQSRYRISKQSFEWPSDLLLTPKKLQLLELAAKAWNNQVLEPAAQAGLLRLKSLGLVEKDADLEPFSPRLLARHAAFAPLASAIDQGFQVVFRYQKPDGAISDRLVSPLKLRQLEGQWVLLGQHEDQIKNFLLRRIVSDVQILEANFQRPSDEIVMQAEQDLVDFVSGNLAVLEVRADSEASRLYPADSDQLSRVHFMDEALFAEDLMEHGPDIRVIEPESLKRKIKQSLRQVIKSHA